MDLDEKRPEPMHPFVDIDGFIADGKQFDLDIVLANDHRDVIYGVVNEIASKNQFVMLLLN